MGQVFSHSISILALAAGATEHGGIVWSRWADTQPLRADTRSWPLPWIAGAVMAPQNEGSQGEGWSDAPAGIKGEVVIRHQYPYMALTVWGSEGFGTTKWRGDLVSQRDPNPQPSAPALSRRPPPPPKSRAEG